MSDPTAPATQPGILRPWEWTHDGQHVLVVRFCGRDGSSSKGYRYPIAVGAVAEAPDWNPEEGA